MSELVLVYCCSFLVTRFGETIAIESRMGEASDFESAYRFITVERERLISKYQDTGAVVDVYSFERDKYPREAFEEKE